MLVLSRKLGERICIGNDVTISVVKISGNRVRIGIEAPDHVEVLRGELHAWTSQESRDTDRKPATTGNILDCCI
ncbi:MAG: carbon storage regulator [Pirellulaceae bacterium]|nr:carbon storage regulator [Pirellulaceae bacterium]